jgi:hypothetical protein
MHGGVTAFGLRVVHCISRHRVAYCKSLSGSGELVRFHLIIVEYELCRVRLFSGLCAQLKFLQRFLDAVPALLLCRCHAGVPFATVLFSRSSPMKSRAHNLTFAFFIFLARVTKRTLLRTGGRTDLTERPHVKGSRSS